MIKLSKPRHGLLVSIHGWSGAILGVLLILMMTTGTVAVMGDEIGAWSAGAPDSGSVFSQPIDRMVRGAIARTSPLERDEVDLSASAIRDLVVVAEGRVAGRDEATRLDISRTGRIRHMMTGDWDEVSHADSREALRNFVVDTHVRLHIPAPWGYLVTGLAGLSLLLMSLTGILIHRELLAHMFVLRRVGLPILTARDRHTVAGSWILLFTLTMGLTGSFFSVASSVGLPALSLVSFGGDQAKFAAALVGPPPPLDRTPVPGANLDEVLADATARAGSEPSLVVIERPGRADARIRTSHDPRPGTLEPITFVYDGKSGRFVNEQPVIGRAPSAGGAALGAAKSLHYGDFGGLLSKIVWAAMGLVACFVAVSGTRLWVLKRVVSQATWAILDRAVTVAAFGTPLAMATAAAAFFLSRPSETGPLWTPVGFIVGASAAIASSLVVQAHDLRRLLPSAAGLVLVSLPLLRLMAGGPAWGAEVWRAEPMIMAGDIAMAGIGLVFVIAALRGMRGTSRKARLSPADTVSVS